jgi:hypothetical protein
MASRGRFNNLYDRVLSDVLRWMSLSDLVSQRKQQGDMLGTIPIESQDVGDNILRCKGNAEKKVEAISRHRLHSHSIAGEESRR